MILFGQLITLAKLRAPSSRLIQHLTALRSQSGLMRLRGIGGALSVLPDKIDEILNELKVPGALITDDIYNSCLLLSNDSLLDLENQLAGEGPNVSELVEMIRATRDEVRELMDWVVLLAGAKPAR